MRPIRDILRHGFVYGIGQVLGRMASILMLPLYTRYLAPADYGTIAILDLVAGVLGIVVGAGMASAVNRFHFETEDEDRRRVVWWTGLTFVTLGATAIVLPLLLAREPLAATLLGGDVVEGGTFLALAVLCFWGNTVSTLPETYLRVRKWSGLVVVLSLGRLVVNVALNVWMLASLGMGVEGVLLGNLATSLVFTAVLVGLQMRGTGRYGFDAPLLRQLVRFGLPIVAVAFLSLLLHDADRWFLRVYAGRDAVGVYSLAYKIGQSVSTLVLTPFAAIWAVSMYEIQALPNPRRIFARVFGVYTKVVALLMLGAALLAPPVLSVIASDSYAGAAEVAPVICLAYVLFALQEHYFVPYLLAKRTDRLIVVFLMAAIVNLVANLVLVPPFGAMGAAWASVVGFATFSVFGWLRNYRIDGYEYPFASCGLVVLLMCGSYVGVRAVALESVVGQCSAAVLVCGVWGVVLFGKDAAAFLVRQRASRPVASTPTAIPSTVEEPVAVSIGRDA